MDDQLDIDGFGSLEKITKEIRISISVFVDPILKEASAFIADKIRFLRFRNSIMTAERAKELLAEAGLKPSPISLKILFPLLEGCALEDDDELMEKWAGLLASASTSEEYIISYSKILSELSPEEAKLLEEIGRAKDYGIEFHGTKISGSDVDTLRSTIDVSREHFLVLIANLDRLGLIYSIGGDNKLFYSNTPIGLAPGEVLGLTYLGKGLLKACAGPKIQD